MIHPHRVHLLTFAALVAFTRGGHVSAGAQDTQWTQAQLEEVSTRIKRDIEAIRERAFERPVAVHTTDGPGFIRYAKERLARMISADEMAIEEEVAKLLFLVPPQMDLWGVTLGVLEEQVGGFYDPQTDAFYLMDSFTGKVAEIIIAHELTHALDDQLFGIDAGLEATKDNGDAAQAYGSVVEGSGTIVMTRWAMEYGGELTLEDLAAAGDFGTEAMGDAPPFVWKPLLSSYLSGQSFLQRGYRIRKRAGKTLSDVIDEAFRRPPASTEQVLHPDKYWKESERDAPRTIVQALDELPAEWQVRSQRVLGELVLALVAATPEERAPIDMTNQLAMAFMKYTSDAAEGWGGDSLALLSRGDARIAHAVTLWDTEKDAREFAAAVEALASEWSAALGALDVAGAGHGFRVLPDPAPDALRFVAWYGVAAPEVDALLATLSWSEPEPASESGD